MSFTFTDLPALNAHLATRSYIAGFLPSQADVTVFAKVTLDSKYPHASRWYNHIASFSVCERSRFAQDKSTPAAAAKVVDDDDMFGDVDEDSEEELREIKAQQAQAALALKRANKPKEVAKSTVVWDVKPTEAETDMAELERSVRSITMDGLLWGSSKLQDVAYGVKKLVITSVVVDDLCSVDAIQEAIEAFDELIQSTDIVAFNKI